MADDLTKLDSHALRSFIDNDVGSFRFDLDWIRQSRPPLQSLYDVAAAPTPLEIGPMAGDEDSGGKTIVSNAVKAAGAIDGVFNKHITAFDDLSRNLDDVITTMLKAQGDNLADVDAQKFLTAIGDYDGDMGGGKSSASSATST